MKDILAPSFTTRRDHAARGKRSIQRRWKRARRPPTGPGSGLLFGTKTGGGDSGGRLGVTSSSKRASLVTAVT